MKNLTKATISIILAFIGMTSVYMFITGDVHSITTWLWLFPAQIIMQPGFKACSTMASNIVGADVDDEKPEDEQ